MSKHPTTDTTTQPKQRRRWRFLRWCLPIALLAGLLLSWLLKPDTLTYLLSQQLRTQLGLVLEINGPSQYRLRGTPQLVLHDIRIRQLGQNTVLLRAERLLLALPWRTLRSAGKDLTIDTLRIDAAQLDIDALMQWQRSRPPSDKPMPLPRLQSGLFIRRAHVFNRNWQLQNLDIDLPSLHPEAPLQMRFSGIFSAHTPQPNYQLHAHGKLELSRPATQAQAILHSSLRHQHAGQTIIQQLQLSSQYHYHADNGQLHLTQLHLGSAAAWPAYTLALGVLGDLHYTDGQLHLQAAGVHFSGAHIAPHFNGNAIMHTAGHSPALHLQLHGQLSHWPAQWPAPDLFLPPAQADLPVSLTLTQPFDGTASSTLSLQQGAQQLSGKFQADALSAWFKNPDSSPLPPLQAHFSSPQLLIRGVRLQGVQIQIDERSDADAP